MQVEGLEAPTFWSGSAADRRAAVSHCGCCPGHAQERWTPIKRRVGAEPVAHIRKIGDLGRTTAIAGADDHARSVLPLLRRWALREPYQSVQAQGSWPGHGMRITS